MTCYSTPHAHIYPAIDNGQGLYKVRLNTGGGRNPFGPMPLDQAQGLAMRTDGAWELCAEDGTHHGDSESGVLSEPAPAKQNW